MSQCSSDSSVQKVVFLEGRKKSFKRIKSLFLSGTSRKIAFIWKLMKKRDIQHAESGESYRKDLISLDSAGTFSKREQRVL